MDAKQGEVPSTSSVLGDEEDTSRSLAATLRLAAAKGYIDKANERRPGAVLSVAKRAKLEAKSYTVEEKKFDDKRDRRIRGARLHEVKEPADYKPELNFVYTDDTGRKLDTPKEAYRYLCHKFHGKGPGKNKIDKRLKKRELESKARSGLAMEAPTSSASLMVTKQKESKTPFLVISKGK